MRSAMSLPDIVATLLSAIVATTLTAGTLSVLFVSRQPKVVTGVFSPLRAESGQWAAASGGAHPPLFGRMLAATGSRAVA